MCEKNYKCGRYWINLSSKYRKEPHTVEYLDSFGSGSISNKGCDVHYVCGDRGDYAMYEPIEMESDNDDKTINS
jgi:hypothetical protein